MSQISQTPASLGYRMPAEWEKHEATWLSWPCNLKTLGSHLEGAENAMTEFIRVLSKGERVDLLVAHEGVEQRAKKKLDPLKLSEKQLRYHRIESGDLWIRDYGPIFIKNTNGDIAWTKWGYNAYGKPDEYEDLMIGNDVPDKLPIGSSKRFDGDMVLEGGSIDVNGSGTLLTTESCLLSPTRNPHLTKHDIEQKLRDYLGVTNILWLSEGIEGDDTAGHVDDLTRFVSRNMVVTAAEENTTDKNYAALQENFNRLKTMKDETGVPLQVVKLPMPKEFTIDERRMAASYANFYIANDSVLVPTYNQTSDKEALKILGKCFPDRSIVGIDCCDLIWGYGSIHCATQQQPK